MDKASEDKNEKKTSLNSRTWDRKVQAIAAFIVLLAAGGLLVYAFSDNAPPSTEDETGQSSDHSDPVETKTNDQHPDGETSSSFLDKISTPVLGVAAFIIFGWIIWEILAQEKYSDSLSGPDPNCTICQIQMTKTYHRNYRNRIKNNVCHHNNNNDRASCGFDTFSQGTRCPGLPKGEDRDKIEPHDVFVCIHCNSRLSKETNEAFNN